MAPSPWRSWWCCVLPVEFPLPYLSGLLVYPPGLNTFQVEGEFHHLDLLWLLFDYALNEKASFQDHGFLFLPLVVYIFSARHETSWCPLSSASLHVAAVGKFVPKLKKYICFSAIINKINLPAKNIQEHQILKQLNSRTLISRNIWISIPFSWILDKFPSDTQVHVFYMKVLFIWKNKQYSILQKVIDWYWVLQTYESFRIGLKPNRETYE